MANGQVDTVEAVLALSKADLTLRHLVALRNRVLEAFQEVMRLPL
jgi:flagellar hook-basal body complex protein FliE